MRGREVTRRGGGTLTGIKPMDLVSVDKLSFISLQAVVGNVMAFSVVKWVCLEWSSVGLWKALM